MSTLSFVLLAAGTPVVTTSAGAPLWAYVLGALGIGGIVAAAFTFFGRRRETSGRIDTTEAAKLWDEAGVIRTELRDEVVQLRADKDALSGKIDLLNTQMETLRDKHIECQQNEALLRARVETLEGAVERRRKAAPAPRRRTT